MKSLTVSGIVLAIVLLSGDLCDAGITRYESNGNETQAGNLWIMSFVRTEKVWFKDPEEAEVNKVIRADVVTSTHGDDVCRNKCVANPECQSYNLAQLSELEFYCELTKYFYTDTDMVKTDQTDEGKDNWSFLERRPVE